MSGDRRGTDREPRSDFTSRELAALEILEDLTPGWVAESSEYSGVVVHESILATLLISINPTVEQRWLRVSRSAAGRWNTSHHGGKGSGANWTR